MLALFVFLTIKCDIQLLLKSDTWMFYTFSLQTKRVRELNHLIKVVLALKQLKLKLKKKENKKWYQQSKANTGLQYVPTCGFLLDKFVCRPSLLKLTAWRSSGKDKMSLCFKVCALLIGPWVECWIFTTAFRVLQFNQPWLLTHIWLTHISSH